MANAQAVTTDADEAVVEKQVNPSSKYMFEAKTSRNSSRRARDCFVPAPPPYTPSNADVAVAEKPVSPYNKYIFTRNQGDMPQVVQANPYVSYDAGVETKILKHIDYIDSEIESHEKEIGKLLNL